MFRGLADHTRRRRIGGMALFLDREGAIRLLRERGHRIGVPYTSAAGINFVVTDDVAMIPGHAIALAEGRLTLQQIIDAAEIANSSNAKPVGI